MRHLALGLLLLACSCLAQAEQFRVLVFSKSQGWHHQAIAEAITGLRALAARHDFAMDWDEDPARINPANLAKYQVIIFLLTTGDILNAEQQAAMESFIRSGKGFVGVHSAADTEYDWPWYKQLVGRNFYIHPVIQSAKLQLLERNFPGLEFTPERFLWTDEWYEFGKENVKGLHYLLAVDESSYNPAADWGNKKGTGMGKFHPVAWYHPFDGGRAFYTGLGHIAAIYSDPWFLAHLYGGIYWAATGKGLD